MSRFPSSRVVTRLTRLNTRARVDTCDILRQSLVTDPNTGAQSPADPNTSWPVVSANVSVRVEVTVRSPRESLEAGAVTSVATFRARFPVGTDIRLTDRFVGKSGGINGRTFQITGADFGSNETARIMFCEEVI